MAEASFLEQIEKIKMPIRVLILVGTVVLVAGLFVWFIYLPKTTEIAQTKMTIRDLTQKLNRAKIKAKDMKKFQAEKALVDAQFQDALKLLPNKKEIPSLLKSITQLGSDSQLEFRLFSPKKEKAREFYYEIPVAIEVSGNYHNVAVFFDKVGGMERIVNILNVSMKPVASRSTNLKTTCDAVTYRFKASSTETSKKDGKKK
ncbi:type 4a pilus biogenesis protein PilO [Thermodesulfobacteriota bacterium]